MFIGHFSNIFYNLFQSGTCTNSAKMVDRGVQCEIIKVEDDYSEDEPTEIDYDENNDQDYKDKDYEPNEEESNDTTSADVNRCATIFS